MMNRRGFLHACLATGIAPAVVRAAWLMPVRQLESGLVLPVSLTAYQIEKLILATEELIRVSQPAALSMVEFDLALQRGLGVEEALTCYC